MKWQESEGYRTAAFGFNRWWRNTLFGDFPADINGVWVTPRDVEWVMAEMLGKLKPEFKTFVDRATAAWLDSDLPRMLEVAVRNFVRRKLDVGQLS